MSKSTQRVQTTWFRAALIALLSALAVAATLLWPAFSAREAHAQEQPSSPPYDPAQVTVPAAPPLALAGRASYQENCAPCHGAQGLGDGPTVADLPGPPTAFADSTAVWEKSPAMLFHTTKFGRMEKLMPPWGRQLGDEEIWNTVAFAWSLHTKESETRAGAALYAESCASCHGAGGAGDGPEATGELPDFTDLDYTIFKSQADWLAGWQAAHPEIGAEWALDQQESTLEYVRTFSYAPPWVSPYRPGAGIIAGTVTQGTPDGPDVGGLPVELSAFLGFDPIATFTTTLDAAGNFTFTELATDPNIAYLVSVANDGISYSSDFLTLAPEALALQTGIAVYQGSDDDAGVRIDRSHWILDSQPGAVVVGQIYTFGNTGNRTFVGKTVEGMDEPATVGLKVPPGAVELSFENGTLGDRFQQVGDVIYDTLPVVPGEGTRQIIVRYALPHDGTSLDVAQDFLYPVDQLTLLVGDLPDLEVDVPDMEAADPQTMGDRTYRLWRSANRSPGLVEVTLAGLLEAGSADPRSAQTAVGADGAVAAATVAPTMDAWVIWVMLAILGGAIAALVVVAVRRGAFSTAQRKQDVSDMRQALVQQIADLDDRRAMGQIGEADWLRQRSELKAQLMEIMSQSSRTRGA
jgi:mono/diheme cytochrome c family protein